MKLDKKRLNYYIEHGLYTKYDILAWYDMSEYAAEDIAQQVQEYARKLAEEKQNRKEQ